MIPKTIHCIWFGGNEFPALEKKCIESWKKNLPEYEIIYWNESNYNNTDPSYIKALKNKKWAYCSDVARLDLLYKYGGIYLDTDMEVTKSLSRFLDNECFLGKESERYINAAIIGAEKNNDFIAACLDAVLESMRSDFIPIPKIMNEVYKKNSFKINVYERDFFYPYNPFAYPVKNLMFSDITPNTHAIHHWNYSWKPSIPERIFNKVKRTLFKKTSKA
ncbi:hypothetical protein ED28_14870 [[Pantoea] beijingensis]|uniref:Glycosyl transferase n=1 Tax=[Pantoea] beijingensis TaxID=1324864 RepID=A0A443IAF9_9GAMM|nr:glycosyltransferase [[Pantoea] beijingensis]RWR01201.1 hypothetical protein ED28_14870 [[Pantoea] beijingensis]